MNDQRLLQTNYNSIKINFKYKQHKLWIQIPKYINLILIISKINLLKTLYKNIFIYYT